MTAAKWILYFAGVLAFIAAGRAESSVAGAVFAVLGGASFGVVMGIKYNEGFRAALAKKEPPQS